MGFTIEIGKKAPDFSLRGVDDKIYGLKDFEKYKFLIVAFSCNHCPYVIGSEDRIIAFAQEVAVKNVGFVAINSNEDKDHPLDSFLHMVKKAKDKQFSFPYLRDETQDVAKGYGAERTPNFFLLDQNRTVVYTGRMDDNPKEASLAKTHELRDALEALLAGQTIAVPVTQAIGCNIKWWSKDAHWMPNDLCDFIGKT